MGRRLQVSISESVQCYSLKFVFCRYLFGLYHVDFNDPERPRTKKASAKYFKELISKRKLPNREENAINGL